MKTAILCNGINWTIKKNYLQHVENKSPYKGKATE